MTMRLTSSAFPHEGKVPTRFTCDGADVSPPLAWSGPPAGTRSFAVVCSDPDAPAGTWYHWAIYDIPHSTTQLAEHWPANAGMPPQAFNDFRKKGYGGPCPPHGHGRHHYHFKLFALNVDHLGLPAAARARDVEEAAERHGIATAELVGVYSR